ncbi:hypothetical protein H5410_050663 [Solanum commersonii]|uniref:Uncharacterized protein n=1 Tax=Solanum commersonii TaxID=4109 RepID=A0A9J5WY94_SOLCO|nr:hypothetical protein H5410_050663 [Solanum commersonii]
MSTHSLGHQSSSLSFATSLSRASRKHMGGCAKSEESKSPKSNSLELKPSSSSIFKNLCCNGSFSDISRNRRLTRRLALLLVHFLLCFAFSMFVVWIIGLYIPASQNYSGFAYLNKGRSMSLRRLAKCAWRSSGFSFFILFSPFVPFCV